MESEPLILLVEDDPDQTIIIRREMEHMKFRVQTAATSAEALEAVRQLQRTAEDERSFDLILVDYSLPDGDGIELVQDLRRFSELKYAPIIMMSAHYEEATVLSALKQGADEFIGKPIKRTELAIRVKTMLELKWSRSQLARERDQLARYFSEDLIEYIASGRSEKAGGEKLRATFMFFDLRGSTRIAEEIDTELLHEFLNNLFTDLMDLVFGNGGSVNKFHGDGLLATFGCPRPGQNDAYNAVKCALDIRKYIDMFNEVRPDYLREPIRAGMGIATGTVFAGNIGSVRKMEYTVLGDAVNIASRLESLTKEADGDILIDGATRDELGAAVRVRTFEHDALRGKLQAVRIYLLDGLDEAAAS